MSFTKLSLSAMPALASKMDEWVSPIKSVETTWVPEFLRKHVLSICCVPGPEKMAGAMEVKR